MSVSGDAYGAKEPIFCYYKIALIHLLLVSATCSTTLAAAAPVRSFRRNLASSSASKRPPADPRNGADDKTGYKGMFVKVNMDGVPIGRKVDLKAQGDYGNLSVAVDRLFRDLLAAQRDQRSCAEGNQPSITGLLDGSGVYRLVYEDDEGDQMLVGDVPWDMFIATAKRLRVPRSSDLKAPSLRAALSRKRGAADQC
ncbi:auxin-responsive protein IAA16-like isoform X2 [Lolium perenne]|nr:auxin-responsive protein IAA16-like isoform X2 [Lolium perenne]